MAFRRLHPDHRARNRWVVRGSRLFSRVSARTSDETKIAGVDEIRTKSGSPPVLGWSRIASTRHHLEDEDDDEDENDVVGERANALGNSREPPAKWLFGRFASNG